MIPSIRHLAPLLVGVTALALVVVDETRAQAGGSISVTDQFEYSFGTADDREIVENWLDLSYESGGFRGGLLLGARQPAEEGDRSNELRHRFLEFTSGDLEFRVGHFYGIFGRGLVFNAYEDRLVRVDTALDGLLVKGSSGRWRGQAFTGTNSAPVSTDVRGLDGEVDLPGGLICGVSGLTYLVDGSHLEMENVLREIVAAGRVSRYFSNGDAYVEYGWKKGYDSPTVPDGEEHNGHALYGALNLYAGAFGLTLEQKDYEDFAVVPGSDGRTNLNRPPALTREHLYTLLNRSVHNLDPRDERGHQAELTWYGPRGWSLLANANRTSRDDDTLLFEEFYTHVDREAWGPLQLRAGFGYQEAEGQSSQTVVADATWHLDPTHSLVLIAQHQHLRPAASPLMDTGEFDREFVSLELGIAPKWTFALQYEADNAYAEQLELLKLEKGPFPAVTVSYATASGSRVGLWVGKRQAGKFCAGGVCKYEPAFEGFEVFGTVRY